MDKPWKVIVAFIGVFIAGAVFGGVFSLRSAGKRMPGPPPGRAQGPAISPGGPQIDPTNKNDVVADQSQVDDLLDSLGF